MNNVPIAAPARPASSLPVVRERTAVQGPATRGTVTAPSSTEIWVVSTVHQPDDVRIFWKQAVTLAAAGYEVTSIFWTSNPSAAKEDTVSGVRRRVLWKGRKLPGAATRLLVLLRTLRLCLRSPCRNFLFHDPELIPLGIVLTAAGRKVIFDAHEDFPLQTLHKTYLAPWQKPLVKGLAQALFVSADRWLSGQLYANAITQQHFRHRSCFVRNFPLLREFPNFESERRPGQIVYVGGLTEARGILELVQAVNQIASPASLVLAGPWESEEFRSRCLAADRANRVVYAGTLDRNAVGKLLAESSIGVAVLHPFPAHVNLLPVKLFEYMAAGLPVVVSDFPLWRGIVASANCGVLVEPGKADALQVALEYLLNNPGQGQSLGANGRMAVEQRYTWEAESTEFLTFMGRIFGTPNASEATESLALPA